MFRWAKFWKIFTRQIAESTDARGQYVNYSVYVDLRRADLFNILRVKEPILPLGGVGEFDEFGTCTVFIIRAGYDVRAYYAGWTRCESVPFNVFIGLATCPNGDEMFTKQGWFLNSSRAAWPMRAIPASCGSDLRSAAATLRPLLFAARKTSGRSTTTMTLNI